MGRIPICPQHKCHPDECFEIHYPNSTRGEPVDYERIRADILRERMEEQNARIRYEREKMDENVINARKKFRDAQNRRGA